MSRNKVQFQKCLSLNGFLDRYGSKEQCRDILFKARWPMGFMCPQCGHAKYYLVSTRNIYQCRGGRYQCSLTNDTIFASSKLPLTTWFLRIFFLTQSQEEMSTLKLRRLLGISVNAAMKMEHKLQPVMKIADDSLVLDGLIELDDAYWGGKRSGDKRGWGAPEPPQFLEAIARNEKEVEH